MARDRGDHRVGVCVGHPQFERRRPGRQRRRLAVAGVPRAGRRVDPVGDRHAAEIPLDDADDRGERRRRAADHHRRSARQVRHSKLGREVLVDHGRRTDTEHAYRVFE
jgi:hypothetical protein